MSNKLTQKQENFCQNILKGMTQHDAYKNSYDAENMLPAVIDDEAYKLAKSPEISLRIADLRAVVTKEYCVAPVGERLERLSNIVRHPMEAPVSAGHIISASDQIAKLLGDYPPERHAVIGDIRINVRYIDKQIEATTNLKETDATEQS